MQYILTDDSGKVLDRSPPDKPLWYLHGRHNVIAGLEKALEGAVEGYKGTITIAPADGYGERNPTQVFEEPFLSFPSGRQLLPGQQVYSGEGAHATTYTVVRLTETGVVLDANHPLAGVTLHFAVEIVGVRKATREETAHGHVHTRHEHH